MIYAAGKAKLAFIINVVLDENKKVIEAFAGHYEKLMKRDAGSWISFQEWTQYLPILSYPPMGDTLWIRIFISQSRA